MTELLTPASSLDPIDIYLPALPPQNLRESTRGGLRRAIEERPPYEETQEDFLRRLYGSSYEQRDKCDEIFRACSELVLYRQEQFIAGLSHIRPELEVMPGGEPRVAYDSLKQMMAEVPKFFGKSALFYGDWLILGGRPHLEAAFVGERDERGYRNVMIRVTPEVSEEDIEGGAVEVVANPLLYIPTPDEIDLLERISST